MALHREPPLSLKSILWWSSILLACSFLLLYCRKCHTKYVSTNSYKEIRFNNIFLFLWTNDTAHAPKTCLASEFRVLLTSTGVIFLKKLFS